MPTRHESNSKVQGIGVGRGCGEVGSVGEIVGNGIGLCGGSGFGAIGGGGVGRIDGLDGVGSGIRGGALSRSLHNRMHPQRSTCANPEKHRPDQLPFHRVL
jgi:hypothetical protein